MALLTLSPERAPSSGTTNKPEIKLLEAEFGEGYTQTTRAGMNHIRRTLSLTWEKMLPYQSKEIYDFLIARGGDEAFYYTPSGEKLRVKWTCKEFEETWNNDGFIVTAVFKQDFNLQN